MPSPNGRRWKTIRCLVEHVRGTLRRQTRPSTPSPTANWPSSLDPMIEESIRESVITQSGRYLALEPSLRKSFRPDGLCRNPGQRVPTCAHYPIEIRRVVPWSKPSTRTSLSCPTRSVPGCSAQPVAKVSV